MRLRLAVHAVEVAFDEQGVTSSSLTAAFRLVDAPSLKKALADSPGVLAMIVSRTVFDEVVRHCATLDPATFRPIQASTKEFQDLAWIALPDHPFPPDLAVVNQQPADSTTPDPASDGQAAPSAPAIGDAEVTGISGPRAVTITGGVHGGGSGITIGAATGDHFTLGAPPPDGPEGPR